MATTTSWSRRGVLVAAGAAAGAAVLSGPLGSVASAATTGRGTVGLRRSHWTALVGQQVTVATSSGRVKALVVEVEDIKGAPAGDERRFSVELRIDRGRPAIGGVNPITLPGRGVASLFASAVDRGVRHRSFQVIVNNIS